MAEFRPGTVIITEDKIETRDWVVKGADLAALQVHAYQWALDRLLSVSTVKVNPGKGYGHSVRRGPF